MKKALLTIGSMVAVATPVVVAISCGEPEDMTIVLKTEKGTEFTVKNGKVTSIVIDGTGAADKIALIDLIETEAEEAGVSLPTGVDEGKIFGLINFERSTNIDPNTNAEYFATSPDHFHRTPSTHGTNPGTTTSTVNIPDANIIDVNLATDSDDDLKAKWTAFETKYYTPSAQFAVKITKADGTSSSTMVFIMKADGHRTNSFRNDTATYPSTITVGSSNTPWALNYASGPAAFVFFTDFEPLWIAKINAITTDTSDDVTQFDWS